MNEYDDEDELGVEPEWCEHCSAEMEEAGLEYTFDYTVRNGTAYCDHCGRPL